MRTILLTLLILSTAISTGCLRNIEGSLSDTGGVVIEVDQDGNEIWRSYKYEEPSCYYRDEQGNQYVADVKTNQFIVNDADGKLKYQFSAISPQSISVTPDKNVLMVNKGGTDNLIEVNNNGHVVWKLKSHPGINHAVKLINGNYLIASQEDNSIIELDKNAREIWKTPDKLFNNPVEFQVSSQGTYIVADFDNHRVIEIDKTMAPGWDYQENLNHPQAVVRLDNGKYLVSDYDNSRVLVMDNDRNILKEIQNVEAVGISVLPDGNAAIAGKVKK